MAFTVGIFVSNLVFVCHLTGFFHSGGNTHSRQNDGLQQVPDGNKTEKDQYLLHHYPHFTRLPGPVMV